MKTFGLLILCTLGFTTISLTNAKAGDQGRVSCYFSNWAIYRPGIGKYTINNIPLDLCTHVIYTFIGISNVTWELMILDTENDVDNHGLKNFTALREKQPNLVLTVAVGGWNEGGKKYSEMVSSKERRCSVIKSIVDFLNKYNFDGIDLDWEYPGNPDRHGQYADKDNFYFFVDELKRAFDKEGKGWTITIAAPMAEGTLSDGYHVYYLCQLVDAIHVMAYDLRGDWDGFAGPHSPLYRGPTDEGDYANFNVNDGLKLWERMGCSSDKLVVGIPTYARTFTLSNENSKCEIGETINREHGAGAPGKYTEEEGTLAYFEIVIELHENKWTEKWDDYGKVPYACKGNQFIGYEDPKSVQIKMDFVKQKGYAGVMVWACDMDDFRGLSGPKNPLLTIMHDNLKDYVVPKPTKKPTPPEEWERPPHPPTNDCSALPDSTTSASTGHTTSVTESTEGTTPPYAGSCDQEGTYVADKNDCAKFYQCDHGKLTTYTCSGGTIFDTVSHICNWPDVVDRPECKKN